MPHHEKGHVPPFKDILDRVIAFVKANLAYLFGLSFVGTLVAVGPLALILTAYGVITFVVSSMAVSGGSVGFMGIVSLLLGLLGIVATVWTIFATIATQLAITNASFHGKDVSIMDALKKSYADRQLFWRFLGGAILIVIMLGIGFLLLVIPGIYLSVPLALWPYVMVKERLGPIDSIKRCFALAKGFWWTMFSRFVWMGVLVVAVQVVLNGITFGLVSVVNGSAIFVVLMIMSVVQAIISAAVLAPLQLVFGRHVYEHVTAAKAKDANASQKLTGQEKGMLVAALIIAFVLNMIAGSLAPKYGTGNMPFNTGNDGRLTPQEQEELEDFIRELERSSR